MTLSQRITKSVLKTTPMFIKNTHNAVPFSIKKWVVLHSLRKLIDDLIENNVIDFMDGKIAKVCIRDIDISWYFTKYRDTSELVMIEKVNTQPDVVFSGTLDAMVLMASKKKDPDTLFFNRELCITGDTELGLEIKNLIDQFELEALPKTIQYVLNRWAIAIID